MKLRLICDLAETLYTVLLDARSPCLHHQTHRKGRQQLKLLRHTLMYSRINSESHSDNVIATGDINFL